MGILIFGELPEYKSFTSVIILLFQNGLGQWDFTIYDQLSNPLFAQTFQMIFIVVNMVMFVNLMIAILSETYQRLSSQRLGLYYDGVIEVIPAYKYKKFYGALIAACPPFNLLVLPFMPLFIYTRHPKKVRRLNNILVKVIFSPFAIIYGVFFALGNLLMMPFAYVYVLYCKIKLVFHRDLVQERYKRALSFLVYLMFGPVLLSVSQMVDIYYFFVHLFSIQTGNINSDLIRVISFEGFNTLEAIV
jgi:hypothetical protein